MKDRKGIHSYRSISGVVKVYLSVFVDARGSRIISYLAVSKFIRANAKFTVGRTSVYLTYLSIAR